MTNMIPNLFTMGLGGAVVIIGALFIINAPDKVKIIRYLNIGGGCLLIYVGINLWKLMIVNTLRLNKPLKGKKYIPSWRGYP